MRYILYIFISSMFIIACSSEDVIEPSDSEKISVSEKNSVIEKDNSKSTFDFEFTSGKTFSSNSIKESGSPHFLYFFSPTWGHCISELQKLKSNLKELSTVKIIAISIDPTMKEGEFDKFRMKNDLNTLNMLPYNRDMILFFEITMRGSKRILDKNSKLIYSGNMMDYEMELWSSLLNEQ